MALSIEPWPVMTIPSRSVSVSRAARRTSIPSPSGRWMSTIRRRGSHSWMARLASFTVPTERASPPRSLTDSSSPFRVARSSSTMRTFKPTPPEARELRILDLLADRAERHHRRRPRTTSPGRVPFPNSFRLRSSAARTISPDPPREDCPDSRCARRDARRTSPEKRKQSAMRTIRSRSRRVPTALLRVFLCRPRPDLRSVPRPPVRRRHRDAERPRSTRRRKSFRRRREKRAGALFLFRRARKPVRARSSRSRSTPKDPRHARTGGWPLRGGARPPKEGSRDRERTCAGTGGEKSLHGSPRPASTRHPLCYKHPDPTGSSYVKSRPRRRLAGRAPAAPGSAFVSQDAAQSVRVRGARHYRGVAVLHGQSGADALRRHAGHSADDRSARAGQRREDRDRGSGRLARPLYTDGPGLRPLATPQRPHDVARFARSDSPPDPLGEFPRLARTRRGGRRALLEGGRPRDRTVGAGKSLGGARAAGQRRRARRCFAARHPSRAGESVRTQRGDCRGPPVRRPRFRDRRPRDSWG